MYSSGFVKSHPLLAFYFLAFAISWSSILVVTGPRGIPGNPEHLLSMLPVLMVAMLAGPTIATAALTGFLYGTAGYREILSGLVKWRTGIESYAAALLTAPSVWIATTGLLSVRDQGFLPKIFTSPSKGSLLLMGVAAGAAAGFFEELGWTGFAVPKLRTRLNSFHAGVIIGFLWGAWHLLINFWASGTSSGTLSIPNFLASVLFSFGILPPYRILMIRAWDRTGSLLLAMLMHMSLTASSIIFSPTAVPGMMSAVFVFVVTALLWGIVTMALRQNR